MADPALAFPRAQPQDPNGVKVAAKSTTVWTLASAATLKVVETTTDWLQYGWDGLLTLFGLLPVVTAEVKEQVGSAEQLSSWLKFNPKVAASVVTAIVIAGLVVAIVRHTNAKKEIGQ